MFHAAYIDSVNSSVKQFTNLSKDRLNVHSLLYKPSILARVLCNIRLYV